MELDRRQWYVRWFFWSLMVWNEFKEDDDSSWRYRTGTNLCHFLRVMLVWCPLVLLLNAAVYGSGIAVLTVLPIYFYGGVGYAWIIGVIVFVVGLLLAVKFVNRRLSEWSYRRSAMRVRVPQPPRAPITAPTGPTFLEVLLSYIIAVKMKVCPTVTFKSQAQGGV